MQKLTIAAMMLPFLFALTACNSSTDPAPTTAVPSPTAAASAIPKEEAEKLIRQLAVQGGANDSTAEMRLSFTDADGTRQQMDFRLQRKYEGNKVSTLMTVLAPKEESEKALLAVEEEGKPTEAISYLAGLKKITRLKSDSPLNFRGAKNTVQEILGMELGKYEIQSTKFLSEPGTKDGDWAVELLEKRGLNLAFPKIEIVFGGKGSAVRQFILYDAKGEKVKTIKASEIKAIQQYPAVTKLDIEDHRTNVNLKLETRSIKYDSNLPSSLFTEANLIKTVTAASQKAIQ